MTQMQMIFDKVYETKTWTDAGNGSGPGSALGPDHKLVLGLTEYLLDLKPRKILDLSCGGMAWWPFVLEVLPKETMFLGYDVSGVVIERNRAAFPGRKNWVFRQADARQGPVPEADFVMCRHTLNHLPQVDALAVIDTARHATRQAMAFTHSPGQRANPTDRARRPIFDDGDGRATRYTKLNLEARPFNLAAPVHAIEDVKGEVLAIFTP